MSDAFKEVTLLASAARTTTQTSDDLKSYDASGLYVIVDVTVVPGSAPSLVTSISLKDPASGKYIALLTGAAITGVSTNIYKINPNLVAVTNLVSNDICPRTFRIAVTAGNANSATYSVGYILLGGDE